MHINCLSKALMSMIFAVALLSGCHSEPTSPTSKVENVLNRGNAAEPATLDPAKVDDVYGANIVADLFQGLTDESPNSNGPDNGIVPGVASHWKVSNAGKVYTFYLRDDAKWSNGQPVTADDFVYGIRRAVDPHTASTEAYLLYPVKNAELINAGKAPVDSLGIKALDSHTVQITLEAVTPYILQILANPIAYPLYKPNVDQWGNKFTQPGHLISNGAYELKSWIVNDHIQLVRNPYYWDNTHTSIDTVNYYPIVDSTTELKMYESGQLDYTNTVPSDSFQEIKRQYAQQLHVFPSATSFYLAFNLKKPPFNKVQLRQALSMAIDRKAIAHILAVGVIPQYNFLPAGMGVDTQHTVVWADWPRARQIAEAKKLYQAAGYSDSHPLHVTILYNTNNERKKIVTAIQAMWLAVLGAQVELRNEEFKSELMDQRQGNFSVTTLEWVADYNDPYAFLSLLTCNSTQNIEGYCNPQYDQLLVKASHTINKAQRMALYGQASGILMKSYIRIPIFQDVMRHLVKKYVGNYHPTQILDHQKSKNWHIIHK